MQNNMLSEKFDLQLIVGELSANVKTEAVKSNLAERINNLAAWQNLKNIQHASMQIASASPVYDKVKVNSGLEICFLMEKHLRI